MTKAKPPCFWEHRHLALFGVRNTVGYSPRHAEWYLRDERRTHFDGETELWFLGFARICWCQWPFGRWQRQWLKLWWLQARISGWRKALWSLTHYQTNPGNACYYSWDEESHYSDL